MLSLLEKSILATIAYYDVLDYPMTGFEVYKYLINPSHIVAQSETIRTMASESLIQPNLVDILKSLENKNLKKLVEEKNGFYALRKVKSGELKQGYIDRLIKTRIDRQKIADQKWRKARKIVKWFELIPYLRAVFVSGSLALDNVKEQSDIDLLIIAKHKRIWTVRFLITLLVHIMGKRRYGEKTADRICLNHYITDESLKIDFPSLYNSQTYAHLVPVIENEKTRLDSQGEADARLGIYNKFQKANEWISEYVAFYSASSADGPSRESDDQRLIKGNKFLRNTARFQEVILNTFLGTILEKILALFQKLIIKRHRPKEEKEGRVIADDFQLEFHPASPEKEVIRKYNENIIKLGFKTKEEKDSGLA